MGSVFLGALWLSCPGPRAESRTTSCPACITRRSVAGKFLSHFLSLPHALEGFFRFPHEEQAAGTMQLDAGLDAAKKGLAAVAGGFAGVEVEGAAAAGEGLRQGGAVADPPATLGVAMRAGPPATLGVAMRAGPPATLGVAMRAGDLAAGELEALAADFQAPAPAFPLPVVHHRPGEGVAGPAVEVRGHEHMPAAALDDEPGAAFVPVA